MSLQSEPFESRSFDHACCPVCAEIMKLVLLKPRFMYRSDRLERHTYQCTACGNVSRFTVDTTA
jgi:hypothetical protein